MINNNDDFFDIEWIIIPEELKETHEELLDSDINISEELDSVLEEQSVALPIIPIAPYCGTVRVFQLRKNNWDVQYLYARKWSSFWDNPVWLFYMCPDRNIIHEDGWCHYETIRKFASEIEYPEIFILEPFSNDFKPFIKQ